MKGGHIGEFEEFVLLVVSTLETDAYGIAVQAVLERETTRRVSLGAVYAALYRLESKGLVQSTLRPGSAVRRGRRRRAFVITREGTQTLDMLRHLRERFYRSASARVARSRS